MSAALALCPWAAKAWAFSPPLLPSRRTDNPKGLGESPALPADCLVLGAGISGVTAARDIVESSGASVIVLEASGRVGGRMHTLRNLFGTGLCAEEGAEFIHVQPHPGSAKEDPMWGEVRRYGLTVANIPHVLQGMIYYSGWSERRLRSVLEASLRSPGDWFQFGEIDRYRGKDLSAREFLDRRHLSGLTEAMSELELCGHVPGLLEEISILGFKSDRYSELLTELTDHHVVEGYDEVPRRIAQGLDVRLSQRVERIRRTANGVEVSVSGGQTYYARSAVCTFSVGMLKSGQVEFDPPLPTAKLDALKCIELGQVAKLIIPFTRRFWPEKMAMLNVPGADRGAGKTYFTLFYGERESRPMLTAYMTGVDARKFRPLGDVEALRLVCADLDRMFPGDAPTFDLIVRQGGDLQYHRKQWIDDPLARGGYSFLTTAATESVPVTDARRELASAAETQPLFWAGEATATRHPTTPATVHGAHWSGLEVARDVVAYLKKT